MYVDFLRGIYWCKKMRTRSNLMLTFAVAAVVFTLTGPSKCQENLPHYNSTSTDALTGKNDSEEFPLPVGRLMLSMMPPLDRAYISSSFIVLEKVELPRLFRLS